MGIGLMALEFFNRSINRTIGSINGMRMAELGDQKLWKIIRIKEDGGRVWAKELFEAQGCHHYSIDIHGRNGSHPLDLSEPIEDEFWHRNFDIVTNFGTSEHVEDQFTCWYNIHRLGRPGCVYIHLVPEFGKYRKDHCKYFYNREFFVNLAAANDYTMIFNEPMPLHGHLACCYIKPCKKGGFLPGQEELVRWVKEEE